MATDAGTYTIDAKDLAKHITLTVRLGRLDHWLWRVNIAKWLIRLAAWIMWVNVEIEVES
jgi:hypothetical protein